MDFDRLSTLPDDLLVRILSHTPLKTAVTTSTLSHRWQHLWTHLTHFTFSFRNDETGAGIRFDTPESFFSTITTILSKLASSPKLHSLSISPPSPWSHQERDHYSSILASWLRTFCDRAVETIVINSVPSSPQPFVLLPAFVFDCPSLVRLKLSFGVDYTLPVTFNLPNLKKLELTLDDSHRDLMTLLFKSLPKLEDLNLSVLLTENDHLVDIKSYALKRLVVCGFGCSEGTQFLIDAPNLRHAEFSMSMSVGEYVFVRRPVSLRKCVIVMSVDTEDRVGGDGSGYADRMLRLVRSVSGARVINLGCPATFNALRCVGLDSLPSFDNLKRIEMGIASVDSWNDLLLLVSLAPNVKELKLCKVQKRDEGEFVWIFPERLPVCFWSKLKRIEVKGVAGLDEELIFIGCILRHSSALQHLVIKADHPDLLANGVELLTMLKFCNKLFALPKSSCACEIRISHKYLEASSNDFKHGSLDCRVKALDDMFWLLD